MRSDLVPYFPMQVLEQGDLCTFLNPVTGASPQLTPSEARVLALCDGERRWGEVVGQVCDSSGAGERRVLARLTPFVQDLTRQGALWWRSQPMTWSAPPPATSVFWNITGRCNLNCRHCAVGSGPRQPKGLNLSQCHQVIDDMVAFGVGDVAFSGGEPLARHDWYEIATYASACGLKISFSTNGTLVTPKVAGQIATLQADVQVSLDGATPEVHDRFRRVPGAWRRAVQGVRHLVQSGVPVTIGTTVTTLNLHEVPAICDLAMQLGAGMFRIIPFVPFGRGTVSRRLEVSPLAMRRLTANLRVRRQENGIAIADMEFECTFGPPSVKAADPEASVGCGGARSYFTILENGEVLPCHFFAGVEAENVLDHSLNWIWQHSRFLNYFRSLGIADLTGACVNCDWLPQCLGSCRAANFAHGQLLRGNVHCWEKGNKT